MGTYAYCKYGNTVNSSVRSTNFFYHCLFAC